MYKDDTMDAEGGLADNNEDYEIPVMATVLERQVSTPKINDNDLKSSVILPIGNTYAKGKVMGRKIDAIGNSVGRRKENPILDTCKYRVGFDDEEVRKIRVRVYCM